MGSEEREERPSEPPRPKASGTPRAAADGSGRTRSGSKPSPFVMGVALTVLLALVLYVATPILSPGTGPRPMKEGQPASSSPCSS